LYWLDDTTLEPDVANEPQNVRQLFPLCQQAPALNIAIRLHPVRASKSPGASATRFFAAICRRRISSLIAFLGRLLLLDDYAHPLTSGPGTQTDHRRRGSITAGCQCRNFYRGKARSCSKGVLERRFVSFGVVPRKQRCDRDAAFMCSRGSARSLPYTGGPVG